MATNYRDLVYLEFKKDSRKDIFKNQGIKMTKRSKHKFSGQPKTDKGCAAISSEPKNILLSSNAVITLFLVSIIVPFLLGCITRINISSKGAQPMEKPCNDLTMIFKANNELSNSGVEKQMLHKIHPNSMLGTKAIKLPSPKLLNGKKTPKSTYTSKTFHTISEAAATSNTIHLEKDSSSKHKTSMTRKGLRYSNESFHDNELLWTDNNDEVHLPSGQHLLVDIKNVDAHFLNSEERLAEAMVELIDESKLTLLSYHCHSLVPIGVSCAGILLESHITLHTWPLEGVISLDLYTCGSGRLIPVLPSIERLFGIHQDTADDDDPRAIYEPPVMLWSHKLRGFRPGMEQDPLDKDLGADVLSSRVFDLKRPVVSEETKFQQVDVYEVINSKFQSLASYERSLSNDGSYESLHPELYTPDRIIYLDGQIQSSLKGEIAYHEALVHPAMITHPNPRRVAIIGGGEGATLREVLKHDTVEKVVMLEIDDEEVDILREFLPEWSNCSDFSEGPGSCFDDPRTELFTVDAIKWFIDNFGMVDEQPNNITTLKVAARNVKPFDVIIMDALDPNDGVDFAAGLYNSSLFELSLMNGLTDNGILIAQLGRSPAHKDPADEVGPFAPRAGMVDTLQQLGFESLHVYDEAHSEFDAPWSYLVAFKDAKLRTNWHRNEAEIQIQLQKRMRKTKSGQLALKRFDAPTMIEYQVPPKPFETNYCRGKDTQEECSDMLDYCDVNVPRDGLAVRTSTVGEHAGRGLFAARDIAANSCLIMEESAKSIQILPSTWSVIETMEDGFRGRTGFAEVRRGLSALTTYITGYGYTSLLLGTPHWSVDSNINFFMNHGCNGTYNYGDEYSPTTELDVELNSIPPEYDTAAEVYSPLMERHLRAYRSGPDRTLRDIGAGEEILANYLAFVANGEEWDMDVLDMRGQCEGVRSGEITEYEVEHE